MLMWRESFKKRNGREKEERGKCQAVVREGNEERQMQTRTKKGGVLRMQPAGYQVEGGVGGDLGQRAANLSGRRRRRIQPASILHMCQMFASAHRFPASAA